jgi:hypothetical protein
MICLEHRLARLLPPHRVLAHHVHVQLDLFYLDNKEHSFSYPLTSITSTRTLLYPGKRKC